MDKFIARENVGHFRRQLENGVEQPRRQTMLRLLVEQENRLGLTKEQLAELDQNISRLAEIIARQVELIDNLRILEHPVERSELVLATMNDLMATYIAHRRRIAGGLQGVSDIDSTPSRAMDQRILIAQLNVEHYRRKLASEHDYAKRQTIILSLAEEVTKLTELLQAKGDLRQLLDTVARQASDLFDPDQAEKVRREGEARLAVMLDKMPCGIGLVDQTGNWIVANVAMRQFAPRQALARDPQRIERCRAFDADGSPLSPTLWPSAQALRGQTVYPGIDFIYTTDEGQQVRVRVAAAPVRNPNGDIAGAIGIAEELETPVSDGAR